VSGIAARDSLPRDAIEEQESRPQGSLACGLPGGQTTDFPYDFDLPS
jgi:hypothetical protein